MVKKLIMADVHSNLPALKAVFRDVNPNEMDHVICLGDIVGYGPDPNRCINQLQELKTDTTVIAGNHDAVACGKMRPDYFNRLARRAAEWTHDYLTQSNRNYLQNLPEKSKTEDFEFYHGSPREPLTEYITTPAQAKESLRLIESPKLAVGHTHQPRLYQKVNGRIDVRPIRGSQKVNGISSGEMLVLNPGSVGQPRDGNPKACYVLLRCNEEGLMEIEWKRISYEVQQTQRSIRRAELPEALARRLALGQ